MAKIINQRMTAQISGEPVLFLTGMRINNWWRLAEWLSVMGAAGGMMRELETNEELGLLHQETWLGRTIIIVQYWRSYDALERYARDRQRAHMPAWVRFMKRIGLSGRVGIWHETYRITPGNYETIYTNMPRFGLARATEALPITSRIDSARARMGKDLDAPAREAA